MRPSQILQTMRPQVLALAEAHGATRLRVFGSVARGQDGHGSDLDLLVDLQPGASLLAVVGLQQAISNALGVPVDLCTERELDPALRQRILQEAVAL